MRFWTVQSIDVLEILRQNGFYQPDFRSSRFLMESPKMVPLYEYVLQCFNQANGSNLPGVVFAFAKSDNKNVLEFVGADDFYQYMCSHRQAINGFWKQLDPQSNVVLELEYPNNFNRLFIDINDFQLLMPPMMILPPYTYYSLQRITTDLQAGEISLSEFPSGIIQVHLPYIRKENVRNIYSFFDLE